MSSDPQGSPDGVESTDLIIRTRNADPVTFESFCERMQTFLLRFIRARMKLDSLHDAEDVCQEVFLRVQQWLVKNPEKVVENELTFLATIAARVMLDQHRRRNSKASPQPISDELLWLLATASDRPDPVVLWELKQAISSLPPTHQTVIEGVYFQGETLQKVSDRVGCHPATASRYHQEAIDQLRRQL